jgi:hypothetical protein
MLGMDGPGFESRQGQDFSLYQNIDIGSGGHLVSYSMGKGVPS